MTVEMAFPVGGTEMAADHQYALYGALSHAVSAWKAETAKLRFAPIGAEPAGKGKIRLTRGSSLRIRLPAEQITLVLPLAGSHLRIGEATVRLGVPTVRPLLPTPQLIARIVTFKHSQEPDRFLTVARQRLEELGVRGEPVIPLIERGERAGEPRRRIVRIKGKRVVGYTLLVEGLTAEESIRLQENGLGGRTRLGCGFFVPYKRRIAP